MLTWEQFVRQTLPMEANVLFLIALYLEQNGEKGLPEAVEDIREVARDLKKMAEQRKGD